MKSSIFLLLCVTVIPTFCVSAQQPQLTADARTTDGVTTVSDTHASATATSASASNGRSTAYASVDFTNVTLNSFSSVTNPGVPFSDSGGEFAEIVDYLTFSGYMGTGSFRINYIVEGEATANSSSSNPLTATGASTSLRIYKGERTGNGEASFLTNSDGQTFKNITFGQVQSLSWSDFAFDTASTLKLNFSSGATGIVNGATGTYTAVGNYNFKIVGIDVRDAAQNIVGGYTVTSASGTNYATPVPEPAEYALGISILLLSLIFLRQKSRTRRCS